MRPEDVPDELPDHPQEAKLRTAEYELAGTLNELNREVSKALRSQDRVRAAVLLTQLAQTASAGQQAMVRAVQDQMDAMRDDR